jgi:hypothetical protein
MRAMPSPRFLAVAACLALPLVLGSADARAQAVNESKLKVALIYNFIMFTEWPGQMLNEKSKLSVCVAKESELINGLQQLETRSIRNRPLQILPLTAATDYAQCAVLVIDAADRSRLQQIRKKIDRKSVLTILDGEDTNNDGAIIAMSPANGRMVFDVNSSVAQDVQLTISSKLLRLARKVQ